MNVRPPEVETGIMVPMQTLSSGQVSGVLKPVLANKGPKIGAVKVPVKVPVITAQGIICLVVNIEAEADPAMTTAVTMLDGLSCIYKYCKHT